MDRDQGLRPYHRWTPPNRRPRHRPRILLHHHPVALGLGWRPTAGVTIEATPQPPITDYVNIDGKRNIRTPGKLFVRYSPDLKNWSFWQPVPREPSGLYRRELLVPQRERADYDKLLAEYSTLSVPWTSDELAAVKWILFRDPDFFKKHLPFIGYAQFLYEGRLAGGDTFTSLDIRLSYAVSGLHDSPRNDAPRPASAEGPWNFKAL